MEITEWQVIQLAKEISLPLGILVEQLIREKNNEIEKLRDKLPTADSQQPAKEKEENP